MYSCKCKVRAEHGNMHAYQYIESVLKHKFELGHSVYHNHIVSTLKIHLCSQHIGLLSAVSLEVLRNTFLLITMTVPEVVGTENGVTSNLPFLLDPSSIAKMQSQSLVTDTRCILAVSETLTERKTPFFLLFAIRLAEMHLLFIHTKSQTAFYCLH